ncbi:hypothetical protein REPUB_Repub02eG0016300 [Reevesia pubescens]
MDVYIPSLNRLRPGRLSSFAFVRYKLESELSEAVTIGNNRRIDGRFITVKKAAHRWKAQISSTTFTTLARPKVTSAKPLAEAIRDSRSYKEVLLAPKSHSNTLQKGATPTLPVPNPSTSFKEKTHASNPPSRNDFFDYPQRKEVNYDLELQNSEMEWLQRSIIGRLNDNHSLISLQRSLYSQGIFCDAVTLGGDSVLLTFPTKEDMNLVNCEQKVILDKLLDCHNPWNHSLVQREIAYWVTLEEVPIHIWHINFFKSLGDSWGSFIRVNTDTLLRKRLDIARVLVTVGSRMDIPSSVFINVRGCSYKILVSVDESDFSGNVHGSSSLSDDNSVEISNSNASVHSPKLEKADTNQFIGPPSLLDVEPHLLCAHHFSVKQGAALSVAEHAGTNIYCLSTFPICSSSSSLGLFSSNQNPCFIGPHNDPVESSFVDDSISPSLPCGLSTANPSQVAQPKPSSPAISSEPLPLEGSMSFSLARKQVNLPSIKNPAFSGFLRAKKVNPRVYQRQQLRKQIREILGDDSTFELRCSQLSASDSGIANRNSYHFDEALETWRLSAALGLKFEGNKKEVIDFFKILEDQDDPNIQA